MYDKWYGYLILECHASCKAWVSLLSYQGPNHTRGMQGEYLPAIGCPCLPPATPHAGRVPGLLGGDGVWQCLPTRENPLVAEACRATSAWDDFFF